MSVLLADIIDHVRSIKIVEIDWWWSKSDHQFQSQRFVEIVRDLNPVDQVPSSPPKVHTTLRLSCLIFLGGDRLSGSPARCTDLSRSSCWWSTYVTVSSLSVSFFRVAMPTTSKARKYQKKKLKREEADRFVDHHHPCRWLSLVADLYYIGWRME